MRALVVLSGRSNPQLAGDICSRLGVDQSKLKIGKFSNGETSVEIGNDVRGKDVFIIQSGGSGNVNDHFMELLIITHACKISSARRITAVIPSFPYARQADIPFKAPGDTESKATTTDIWQARPGTLVANMLTAAGVDHIITMELHDAQFQGFFDIPVDNLLAAPLIQRYIRLNIPNYQDAVIVSPDSGGAKRATAIAERLGMDFGLVHKERKKDRASEKMMFVGNVTGKMAIIVDDIIDTAQTIITASKVLKEQGATRVIAVITHGILSGNSDDIQNSDIDEIIVSNSIPQDQKLKQLSKLRTFDISSIFAEAIRRIHNGESVSFLFEEQH